MSREWFHPDFATHRAVEIPGALPPRARARLIAALKGCVERQRALADECDAVLRPTGDVVEQDGRVLIAHEPATGLDPAAFIGAARTADAPALWWFTSTLARALVAAEKTRFVHGGIQPGSILLDSVGRLKLADFGISVALESVIDADLRHCIVCDARPRLDETGHRLSAGWSVLDEGAILEHGWISSYFPQEVLLRQAQLNIVADQFALGCTLYLLATGVLPYDQSPAEPQPGALFPPHARPMIKRRRDWVEALDHGAGSVGDLVELVEKRLLAMQRRERFASLAELEPLTKRHVPDVWAAVDVALGEAAELLATGDAAALTEALNRLAMASEEQALPGKWRECIMARIAPLERGAKETKRQRELERSLAEADHLKLVDYKQALALAEQALKDCGTNAELAPLAEWARHIVTECRSQERLAADLGDQFAQAQLELARELAARGEFDDAELTAQTALEDTNASPERRDEARALIAEIQEAAWRGAAARVAVTEVRELLERYEVDAAREQLTLAQSAPHLPDAVVADIEACNELLARATAQVDQWREAIDLTREAIARAAAEDAATLLAGLPLYMPAVLLDARAELTRRLADLRALSDALDTADGRFTAGRYAEALASLSELLDRDDTPASLRESAEKLAARCRTALDARRKAELDDVLRGVDEAKRSWEAGELERCEKRLRQLLDLNVLPEDRAADARQMIAAARSLLSAIATVEQQLVAKDYSAAVAALDAMDLSSAPQRTQQLAASLRTRAEGGLTDQRRRQAESFRTALREAEQTLSLGRLDEAAARLSKLAVPDGVTDEDRAHIAAAQTRLARDRQLAARLEAIDASFAAGALSEASAQIESLRGAVPREVTWLAEGLRQRARKLDAAQSELRDRAKAEFEQSVSAVRAALDADDDERASAALAGAERHAAQAPSGGTTLESLREALRELRAWKPRLAAARTALAEQRPLDALRDAERVLTEHGSSAKARGAAGKIRDEAQAAITAGRQRIAAELAALDDEITQRKRRPPRADARVAALREDSLLTEESRVKLEAIEQRIAAIKPASKLPMILAGVVGVAAIAAVAFFLTRRPTIDGGGGADGDGGGGGTVATIPAPPDLPTRLDLTTVDWRLDAAKRGEFDARLSEFASTLESGVKSQTVTSAGWQGAPREKTATLDAKIGGDTGVAVQISAAVRCGEGESQWSQPKWSAASSADAEKLDKYMIARASARIAERSNDGDLVVARDLRKRFALGDPPLPPDWSEIEKDGFAADGSLDVRLGYPRRVLRNQQPFRLVAIAPGDEVWPHMKAIVGDAAKPEWRLFYVAEAESPAPLNSIADARKSLEGGAARVPTLLEWHLAALKLRQDATQLALFGSAEKSNRYEWCADDQPGATSGWACGGCWLIENDTARRARGSLDQLAVWLAGPLAKQRREHGQNMVSVRPVWQPRTARDSASAQ